MNWDDFHMSMARCGSAKSKDPSTKVGARVVRPDNSAAGDGFNGFPRKIRDTPERYNDRPMKYRLIIHAEMNAIFDAVERDLSGFKMYSTLMPCERCFLHAIQKGITHFVFPAPTAAEEERWGESFNLVRELAKEAGITLQQLGEP